MTGSGRVRDAGAASPVMMCIMAVVLSCALALAALGHVISARRMLSGVADLAAVTATDVASGYRADSGPCAQAQHVVALNAAESVRVQQVSCDCDDEGSCAVQLTAHVDALGRTWVVRAAARARPGVASWPAVGGP